MFLRRNVAGQQFTVPGSLRDENNEPVTAGASIYLNGSNTAGGGTLTHWRNGAWRYTPTQAETDVEILELVLEATNADPIVASARTTNADPNVDAFGAVKVGTVYEWDNKNSVLQDVEIKEKA